jgi:hypothetical protein
MGTLLCWASGEGKEGKSTPSPGSSERQLLAHILSEVTGEGGGLVFSLPRSAPALGWR